MIISVKKINIQYKGTAHWFSLPHHRDQDVILVKENYCGTEVTIAVVDGWHNEQYLPGNVEGRDVAIFAASHFPETFFSGDPTKWKEAAQQAADKTHELIIQKYPKHVSCVGSFLFRYKDSSLLCSIGTINVYVKRNNKWVKPRGIRNNWLDWRTNESGSATFLGRGELDDNKKYSHSIDCVKIPRDEIILIMTDGVDDLLSQNEINTLLKGVEDPRKIASLLHVAISEKAYKQRDDISVLVSGVDE